jgi:hypothetical protein
MKYVDLNSTFNIYYKTNNLASGETILFNVWNESGQQLITDQIGTEIGTDGVYYITFSAPSVSTYLLIVGSNNGSYPKPDVVKVGGPDEKAWYVNQSFKNDQVIPYEIYDSTGATIGSGVMTDVVGGFYYADTSSYSDPWFFEAYPNAKRTTQDISP